MTPEQKDRRDRARFRGALKRGLDPAWALWVATNKGKSAVRADKALSRLEAALPKRSHLAEAVLKGLVGEGYLRVEYDEKRRPKSKKRCGGDPRFAPWVIYRLTKKGSAFLSALSHQEDEKKSQSEEHVPKATNIGGEHADR